MAHKIYKFLSQQTVLVILFSLVLFFSLTAGNLFLSGQNIHNVARQISFDAPIVFGQAIVLIAGGIDLSVGSVLSMAAALTMSLQPHGTWLAVLVALLFGVLVGATNGLLVTKGKIVPFISTLGTMTLVRGVMLTYTRQQPIAGKDEAFTFWGAGSIGPIPVPTLIVLVLLLVLYGVMKYTQLGRNMFAVGGNREAAYLAGIRVDLFKFLAFVISSTCAALAGVLLASRLNSSTIHIGLDTPLLSIAAAIIGGASMTGGRGSVVGAFLGVLSLGILTNGMNLLGVHTYYQIGIRALILISVVAIDAFYANNLRKRFSEQVHTAGVPAKPAG